MALSKPTVGATGWNTQVDALFDRVNELDGFTPASYATDAELAAHEADTTSVHGIADTSVLETTTGSAAKVTTHAGATDPHGDRAFTTSAVATHEADTTSVHGIANTALLATLAQAEAAGMRGNYGNSAWSGGGAEPFPRTNAAVTLSTQTAVFAYFTAPAANTVTSLGLAVTSAGASGLTVSRIGIYTVNGSGDLTLVARTANDTALGATADALNTAALDTTGGYPASYQFTIGQRYAFGILQVGTTPSGMSAQYIGNTAGVLPVIAGRAFLQADLATTYTAGTVGNWWFMCPYLVGLA